MDDYNVSVLSEAKNEYSSRLVTTLTPLIIEGIKSVFNEAYKLCLDNDENNKYLMTFQNFLTRVPKWNSNIIKEETQRIIKTSGCTYLEDLLTCVHITQLKILTSIRVSQKQKKIDINIPKLEDFVHKVYIAFARKIYSNVYLFEKDVMPLHHQKNMRECEVLAQECILNVIRDNMPVENILRAYIDETVEEEIIEEVIEKQVKSDEPVVENMETTKENKDETNSVDVIKTDKIELKKNTNENEEVKEHNVKMVIEDKKEDTVKPLEKEELKAEEIKIHTEPPKDFDKKPNLKFNDTDSVLDLGTNKETNVEAPKTIERLEQISVVQNQKRKEEEALEDEEEDKLKIFDDVKIQLDTLDVHNMDKQKSLKPDPVLTDFEVLT